MIVIDASVAVEWLLRTSASVPIAHRILSPVENLHAPHLLDIEVAQALRRCNFIGILDRQRADAALQSFVTLRIQRYPHTPLLRRVWQLRDNLSAYDALYVALAESLGATLLTRDRKLAAAPGHRARVQVI